MAFARPQCAAGMRESTITCLCVRSIIVAPVDQGQVLFASFFAIPACHELGNAVRE